MKIVWEGWAYDVRLEGAGRREVAAVAAWGVFEKFREGGAVEGDEVHVVFTELVQEALVLSLERCLNVRCSRKVSLGVGTKLKLMDR